MENLYIGIVLAAISGITFIAYKHPRLYKKEFGPKVVNFAVGIFIVSAIYDAGITAGHENLLPLLNNQTPSEIQAVLKSASVSQNVYLTSIAAFFYSVFLSWLASHMEEENGSTKN